ncbi:MAG TPA: ATP-binding protein [Gemmatimonadales bacterium]|nr:ATP-binding protein [Gemmatimonadales bacterium]
MSASAALPLSLLPAALYDALRAAGRAVGLELGEEVFVRPMNLTAVLANIRAAGGTWHRLPGLTEYLLECCIFSEESHRAYDSAGEFFTIGDAPYGGRDLITHATGAYSARVAGEDYLVAGSVVPTPRARPRTWDLVHCVVMLGRTGESLRTLCRTLGSIREPQRLQCWGGAPRSLKPPRVEEADVILAPELKRDLLGWLDRFWSLRRRAAALELSPHRGLLLAGPPGTGKTQLVRHLLTRYPDAEAHLFMPVRRLESENEFSSMLTSAAGAREGAMIVIEDVDQILTSGGMSREYLLNCLDGMFQLPVPALWVATSNDPRALDQALLDRPGRFDRVVVVPVPARRTGGTRAPLSPIALGVGASARRARGRGSPERGRGRRAPQGDLLGRSAQDAR